MDTAGSRALTQMRLNVYATDGAALVASQPLVDAFDVEEMHAWQPSHVFVDIKLIQTNGALVQRIVGVARLFEVPVLVRERVSLDDLLGRAAGDMPRMPMFHYPQVVMQPHQWHQRRRHQRRRCTRQGRRSCNADVQVVHALVRWLVEMVQVVIHMLMARAKKENIL